MSKVIVVGGGPAGMFAAIAAAERGHEVVLLEKMKSRGKKLYITGRAVQHHECGGYGHPVCQCDDEPKVFVQRFLRL